MAAKPMTESDSVELNHVDFELADTNTQSGNHNAPDDESIEHDGSSDVGLQRGRSKLREPAVGSRQHLADSRSLSRNTRKKYANAPRSSKRKKHKKINKTHPEFELTYDMMLGIRTTVGQVESRAWRELTQYDFQDMTWLRMPTEGSSVTPPHQMRDFKFKDYAPEVFRHIRARFGIDPADYLLSICGSFDFLEFISNSKSGQFFFYNHDRRFMIKTITKAESIYLRKLLPGYYQHVVDNPDTLLTRFYGMHRVKPHKKKSLHFIIIGSVFSTDRYVHTTFDLKGSTHGRSATDKEIKNGGVLKDNDFTNLKMQMTLGEANAQRLIKQIEADVAFLQQWNIMDYSLLLGVSYDDRQSRRVVTLDDKPNTHPSEDAQVQAAAVAVGDVEDDEPEGPLEDIQEPDAAPAAAAAAAADMEDVEDDVNDSMAPASSQAHHRRVATASSTISDPELPRRQWQRSQSLSHDTKFSESPAASRQNTGTGNAVGIIDPRLLDDIPDNVSASSSKGRPNLRVDIPSRADAKDALAQPDSAPPPGREPRHRRKQSNYGLPKRYDMFSKPSDIKFVAPEFAPVSDVKFERADTRSHFSQESFFSKDDGGIRGEVDGKPSNIVYFMGIIDILTTFGVKKRFENIGKSIRHDSRTISAVHPKKYARRFLKYMKAAIQ
jgi:Phosphatidylinositol-4-phosphate 5-Kinase